MPSVILPVSKYVFGTLPISIFSQTKISDLFFTVISAIGKATIIVTSISIINFMYRLIYACRDELADEIAVGHADRHDFYFYLRPHSYKHRYSRQSTYRDADFIFLYAFQILLRHKRKVPGNSVYFYGFCLNKDDIPVVILLDIKQFVITYILCYNRTCRVIYGVYCHGLNRITGAGPKTGTIFFSEISH